MKSFLCITSVTLIITCILLHKPVSVWLETKRVFVWYFSGELFWAPPTCAVTNFVYLVGYQSNKKRENSCSLNITIATEFGVSSNISIITQCDMATAIRRNLVVSAYNSKSCKSCSSSYMVLTTKSCGLKNKEILLELYHIGLIKSE